MARHSKQRTIESMGLMNLKKGQSFYTHKQDKDITAIANYYQKKVMTERLFVLDPKSGKADKLVRVTILN
jgi:hypothetical protein